MLDLQLRELPLSTLRTCGGAWYGLGPSLGGIIGFGMLQGLCGVHDTAEQLHLPG